MRNITKYFLSFFFLFIFIPAFAIDVDNSIINELNKDKIKEIDFDFKLKTFKSCENLENVMEKYVKDYYKTHKDYYRGWIMYKWNIDYVIPEAPIEGVKLLWDSVQDKESSNSSSLPSSGWGFSKTNNQVDWVDESDIIKTDGNYIYYYNQKEKAIYIVSAKKTDDMKIIKKINLPNNFYSPVLYIWKNRLTIIASWYSSIDYSKRGYWINRQNKTYTIIFNTTNIESPKLIKLYVNDGNLRKTRKIGNNIYILSNNYFNIPYYNFKNIDNINVNVSSIIPKKLEITKTSNISSQNLKLKWKKMPYKITAWNISKCDEIEYILPDEETLKKFNFNPSYNIISVIDTQNIETSVKTKVIAWSNNEIYMSLNNLYLTESIYEPNNFRCPVWANCIMPFYYWWTNNTLIHKMSINWKNIKYKDSTIIPGQPLNQYSMDEKDTNFRIITTEWQPKRSTWLYILDKDLKLVSNLKWIGKWENFQSSRFIWDKLFLVTFKQIDPLFAIDLSDVKNPEILWELKIPWYSTYLHPYDSNHLIGLGYDTTINKWGGTINSWVKVDLYEINYGKKCGDSDLTTEEQNKCNSWDYKWIIVKQLHTLTLWENGSHSEALNNPRMFMWNKAKNTLLLPVTLYKNDGVDSYKRIDFFNGLSVIKITKDTIKEKARVTHIDTTGLKEKRQEECKRYTVDSEKTECRELLDGNMYCPPKREKYVPEYCYKDAPIWSYIANKSWEFRNSFIKRALYIWNEFFSISDKMIIANNFDNYKEVWDVKFSK